MPRDNSPLIAHADCIFLSGPQASPFVSAKYASNNEPSEIDSQDDAVTLSAGTRNHGERAPGWRGIEVRWVAGQEGQSRERELPLLSGP